MGLSWGAWGNGLWAETQGYKLGGAVSPAHGEQRSTAASVEPQVSQPFHPHGPLHLLPHTSAAPSLPGLAGTRMGDWVLPIFQMRMLRPQAAHGARAHAQVCVTPKSLRPSPALLRQRKKYPTASCSLFLSLGGNRQSQAVPAVTAHGASPQRLVLPGARNPRHRPPTRDLGVDLLRWSCGQVSSFIKTQHVRPRPPPAHRKAIGLLRQ